MSSVYVCSGNVTRDATLNTTGNGNKVCGFSIAVNVGFGERASTHFVDCSIWAKRGETLQPMLTKGTAVIVSGELKVEAFTKKDGTPAQSMRLNVDSFDFQQRPKENSGNSGGNPQTYGNASQLTDAAEDDIPEF